MAEQRALSLLDRIGGPYAVSLRGLLLITLPSIVPNLVYDPSVSGGSPLVWGLLGLAGTATGGVVYLALGALVLPHRPRKPRPVTALVVFGLAGVTRGAVIAYLSVATGLSPEPQWTFRLAGAAVLGICWFALAAIVVDAWSRNQAVLTELRLRQAAAESLKAQAQAQLRQARERINEVLVARMLAITAALTAVAQPGGDPRGARSVAVQMHETVADVVRPLSHYLVDESQPPVAPPAPRQTVGQRVRGWLTSVSRDALTIDPYHPTITALVVTPSTVPGGVRVFGLAIGIFGSAVVGAFTWAILTIARTVHARRTPRPGPFSWIPAALVYLAVGAACASVPVIAAELGGGSFFNGWAAGGQVLFVLSPLAALGAAVVAAEDRRRTLAERELEAAVAQAEWSSHRAQQEAWTANRLLARELHGGIQSDMTAAALRLEAWARDPAPQALDEVLADVRRVIERVDRLLTAGIETPPVDARQGLDSIGAVWSSLASVTFSYADEVLAALAADQAATLALIEVVRESLGNAVRHGRASRIEVTVAAQGGSAAGADAVSVRIDDNGVGVSSSASSGLGSRLMDQVCLEWSRTPLRPGTSVRARIALLGESRAHDLDTVSA